ncbi:MAG: NAD(P)/FAD-dependent oxidoreductase [Methanocalculus sp. MSAO_Arc1]|uniref:NAD(P)/FAD-dependent oxidoreductase n=1 Tax=Methanocalculus TaxID=71151 RepID=UPI000FEE795B|nr:MULTISPECIES: NAD(P)/FAD-dependent oxidoreductase [unclassified Methanocalculus]MCP1662393.1 digeranylgeranylglycerophospholipid reductase [Methanocalculus sp. AMF5]RQD81363.1 MAG: NAD(P)/FAD-dependent oxidoreductase [Methanocalculus sp. MSAO_Arc1]
MKRKYDMLVVGGGPGGALAAETAAKQGLSVCLVEKRPAIGVPVRCAEGIGKELLNDFLPPDPKWISSDIEKAKLVAPDGFSMLLEPSMSGNEVGYVLDRKVFDRELIWKAAEAGAEIYMKARASAPIMKDGAVGGAVVEQHGKIYDVEADVVVAADGVESKFAKWAGIDTTVPLNEIETCAQYLMTGIDIDAATTSFYLGNEVAPAGYAWIFPKGDGTANVGLGIGGGKSGDGHRAKDYLDRFVSKNFPDGKTIELVIGGVSVCRPLASTVADNMLIVGDAARVSDPITGGGIYNAMYTGRLAAETALSALENGDTSKAALMPYDTEWRESKMGKTLERNYAVKEVFVKLSDEKLNAIVHSVAKIHLAEFSTLSLIKELIKANPSLIFDLRHLKAFL